MQPLQRTKRPSQPTRFPAIPCPPPLASCTAGSTFPALICDTDAEVTLAFWGSRESQRDQESDTGFLPKDTHRANAIFIMTLFEE